MTTRVGRLPPEGDSAAFDAALDALEAALGQDPVEAGTVTPLLRQLSQSRPLHITADQLTRLLTACYHLTGIDNAVAVTVDEADAYGSQRVGWSCGSLIEDSLFDERRRTRAHIERSVDHARVLHPDQIGDRTMYYRPLPNVPLDRDAAKALLAPYLRWLEGRCETEPTAHLKIVWDAVTYPLPPFEGLFWEWLDTRGEGEDMRLALSLHDLRERAQQRLSWSTFEARLLPLLEAENPLLVAHAAAFIGSLYNDPEDRMQGGGAWTGDRILSHIASLTRHRRAAAGGFLHGIDAMDPNPFSEVERIAPDLDLADWVMTILEDRAEEPYIPGVQMFWFYLHEHYDRDPAMVMRFIEAGHMGVAWMCITENHPPAEGMERALELMAKGSDVDYAGHAQRLLDRLRDDGALGS